MSYREGMYLYDDETAAYQYFISVNSPETWGTMTMTEWRRHRPNGQMETWDQWCKRCRPQLPAKSWPSP